jgi:PEP-CTERM motif
MIIKSFIKSAAVMAVMVLASGAANAAACAVTDVTFSSTYPTDQKPATACSNALDGTGNTPNTIGLDGLWGPGFVEGVTLDDAANGSATGATNVLGGFQFTLSGITAATGGTYTLGIIDTNGLGTPPNLPFFLDFVLYLKGGQADTAAYLFDDTLVDTSGGGVWNVTFLNNGGNIPNLSNISVYVREGKDPNFPGDEIPEPASLALVGLGLLAAAATRRRKGQAGNA